MTRPNAEILDLLTKFGIDGSEIPVHEGIGDDGYVTLLRDFRGHRVTDILSDSYYLRSEVHPWPEDFPLEALRALCGTRDAIAFGIVWRQS